MVTQLLQYIALFYIYSFAGWLMETIKISIEEKKFVNRGFLIGPYCPIYGIGVLAITILLKRYSDDIWITFFMSLIICGVLEYATSYLMEKIFKARWWDYTTKKFNINGRVCLENLILFGVLGTTIVFVANPFFLKYINMVPELALNIVLGIISIIFVIDIIVSYKVIFDLKDISRELKDNTIEISEKVKSRIRGKRFGLYRRIIKAFPKIRENDGYSRIEEIRKKIEDSKEEIKNKIDNSKRVIQNRIEETKNKFKEK